MLQSRQFYYVFVVVAIAGSCSSRRKVFGSAAAKEVGVVVEVMLGIAKCNKNWTMQDVLDEQVAIIKAKVPDGAHAICALSGGGGLVCGRHAGAQGHR